MNAYARPDDYGALVEPASLKIQRLLPGPMERVWAFLTESNLRRKWLAAGEMEMRAGAPFEFIWRNDELTDPPGERPKEFSDEHRMKSRITTIEPPRKLVFTWEGSGDVSFELEPKGGEVLLTVIHRRLANRETMLMVGPGWHMHLDILAAVATGQRPEAFWDGWTRLRKEYDQRLPA
jgi:uncharacterized protein YndB with AHSA1/START domain